MLRSRLVMHRGHTQSSNSVVSDLWLKYNLKILTTIKFHSDKKLPSKIFFIWLQKEYFSSLISAHRIVLFVFWDKLSDYQMWVHLTWILCGEEVAYFITYSILQNIYYYKLSITCWEISFSHCIFVHLIFKLQFKAMYHI